MRSTSRPRAATSVATRMSRRPSRSWSTVRSARPVPRNLDALADLLREARVKRVVVTDWGMPEASRGGLLEVLADEGVELVH